jgi:hypothetical protein
MTIDIDRLTEYELIDLNHRIVERLRLLAQVRAHGEMMKFRIGQRVWFDPGNGPPVTGTLTRYNKKTVTVVADDGHRWNVAPSYLHEAEERAGSPDREKVLRLPR